MGSGGNARLGSRLLASCSSPSLPRRAASGLVGGLQSKSAEGRLSLRLVRLSAMGLITVAGGVGGRLLHTPIAFFSRWLPRLKLDFSFSDTFGAGAAPCCCGRGGSGGGTSSAMACHSGDGTGTFDLWKPICCKL